MNSDLKPEIQKRHASRLAAIQALYQMELTGVGADTVADEFISFRFGCEPEVTVLGAPDEAFFSNILHGVPRLQEEIDALISQHLNEKWKLSRLDSTLRALLRCAVFELMACKDVPAKAVINEYVELSGGFCNAQEISFVNGALDKIARVKRAEEFGLKKPEGDF